MKTVVTITGIRPDFIRMSEVFRKLDQNFNHIMIHSGQHFDKMLSGVFFDELNIRHPNYNLEIGGPGKEHFHQSAELSVKVIELLRKKQIDPDTIIFLGDSNSVSIAPQLKKEGYHITHIEAGMRSYDRRMLEEINRVVCDHCSDLLFVYHDNYRDKAIREGIPSKNIHVVGNTIVEVARNFIKKDLNNFSYPKDHNNILLDIHRPENFKYPDRLRAIVSNVSNLAASRRPSLPVKMLGFGRTLDYCKKFNVDLSGVKVVNLMSYKKYMEEVYNALYVVSDSGTAQEEPALLGTPVLVPREYTERPESVAFNCSTMINPLYQSNWVNGAIWASRRNMHHDIDKSWLGDGTTSQQIVDILKTRL